MPLPKPQPKPKPVTDVIEALVAAAKAEPNFGVPDLEARFSYVEENDGTVVVTRHGTGKEAKIGKSQLAAAVRAIRGDQGLYVAGPGALQKLGITHVSSPIYALLRLLPLNKLIE